MKLYVLIACEESQAECAAFRALGHEAFSCDLQPCRRGGNPDWHIHGDVTCLLEGVTEFVTQSGNHMFVPRWDLIIAHPPCTYLCKVSAQWLYKEPDIYVHIRNKLTQVNLERWYNLKTGRAFFMKCLRAKARYVAVENPLPMAAAELPQANFYLQSSWFGVRYTKKTLYWTRNLPPIMPTLIHPCPKQYVRCSRGKYRSRTFPEVAQAIAVQWSKFIEDEEKAQAITHMA